MECGPGSRFLVGLAVQPCEDRRSLHMRLKIALGAAMFLTVAKTAMARLPPSGCQSLRSIVFVWTDRRRLGASKLRQKAARYIQMREKNGIEMVQRCPEHLAARFCSSLQSTQLHVHDQVGFARTDQSTTRRRS